MYDVDRSSVGIFPVTDFIDIFSTILILYYSMHMSEEGNEDIFSYFKSFLVLTMKNV